ncbi:UbiA family prenyltransferase [Streptomyces sp. MS1.AVA.1]|uniref:UbiA family prenyltransferase n=1 Tax=Streptomyces machairae TaxID=3134109 RepID=A0ABU8US76_9ACTN
MALDDYADATVDSVERPERPVPSGRVPRRTALAVAGGLTAAGLGLAAAAGGRRSVGAALPLAGLVWAYDLKLKSTPAGASPWRGLGFWTCWRERLCLGRVRSRSASRFVVPPCLPGWSASIPAR